MFVRSRMCVWCVVTTQIDGGRLHKCGVLYELVHGIDPSHGSACCLLLLGWNLLILCLHS